MEERSTVSEAAETAAGGVSGEDWQVDLEALAAEADAQDRADAEAPGTPDRAAAGGEAEAPEDAGAQAEGGEGARESFTLKHLDEVRAVGRDEIVALAQKGMDYDRVRAKLEAARGRLEGLEGWLRQAAGGEGVERFMDRLDAARIAAEQGVSQETALARARAERLRRGLDGSVRQGARLRQQADIAEFAAAFPEVARRVQTDEAAIPREVWDQVRRGQRLTDAYALHAARREAAERQAELKRLREELEAERLGRKNARRSTGSLATDGGDRPADPATAGWNSV